MIEFSETAHPIFRAMAVNKTSNRHVCKSAHGAVADICTEVSKDTLTSEKLEAHAAQDLLETMEIPNEPPPADPRTDEQRRGNLLQEYEQQFEQLSDAQKLSKLSSNAGLKNCRKRTIFHHV